jgi:hypothetical protein
VLFILNGPGSGSFHQQAKKSKKKLRFLLICVFTSLSMKTDVNVPSKSNEQNNLKTKFFVAICQPMRKKAGSGSVSEWYGSEDPDPYQNVTDPQH